MGAEGQTGGGDGQRGSDRREERHPRLQMCGLYRNNFYCKLVSTLMVRLPTFGALVSPSAVRPRGPSPERRRERRSRDAPGGHILGRLAAPELSVTWRKVI